MQLKEYALQKHISLLQVKQKALSVMKTIQKQVAIWMIALVGIFSLTNCDENWWYDWDAQYELPGRWEIREITNTGCQGCPYQRGDVWSFYRNGEFYCDSYRGGYYDRGYWQAYGRNISISFDGNTNMKAYIRNFDHDYMTLDVNDYDFNIYYTLRLTKRY